MNEKKINIFNIFINFTILNILVDQILNSYDERYFIIDSFIIIHLTILKPDNNTNFTSGVHADAAVKDVFTL